MKHTTTLVWSVAGATLVLVVLSAVLLSSSRRRADVARRQRDELRSELDRLYAHDPFPSPENVLQTQTNLVQMQEWHTRLRDHLRAGAIRPTDLSPSVFIERLTERTRTLRQDAPMVEGARVVPQTFAFGFDAYLGADARMPEPENVPRLIRQLLLTDALVKECYASGVSRIVRIERVAGDAVGGLRASPRTERVERSTRPVRGTRPTAAEPTSRERETPSQTPLEVERERLGMSLRARPAALTELLNAIATMQPFAVVAEVEVRATSPGLRPVSADSAAVPAAEGRPLPPGADPSDPASLPRELRVVAGPDLETPLDVRIEIDFYAFEGE